MACLLKAPEPSAKGILVFTTQERDNVIGDELALWRRLYGSSASMVTKC
jgi:hypothetical protein